MTVQILAIVVVLVLAVYAYKLLTRPSGDDIIRARRQGLAQVTTMRRKNTRMQ